MEENVNNVFGIEDTKTQSELPTQQFNGREDITSKERLLNVLSKVLLTIGLLGGFIIICMCYPEERTGLTYPRYENVFHPEIFAYGLASILSSSVGYAFCQVVIQISLSLKGRTSLKNNNLGK